MGFPQCTRTSCSRALDWPKCSAQSNQKALNSRTEDDVLFLSVKAWKRVNLKLNALLLRFFSIYILVS